MQILPSFAVSTFAIDFSQKCEQILDFVNVYLVLSMSESSLRLMRWEQ
jgi:hypothetical protein